MLNQDSDLSKYIRISELASTAERKPRIYIDKAGKTRKIKGRPQKKEYSQWENLLFGIKCAQATFLNQFVYLQD